MNFVQKQDVEAPTQKKEEEAKQPELTIAGMGLTIEKDDENDGDNNEDDEEDPDALF